MLPVSLPIYVLDESSASNEAMGIETNIMDSEVEDFRFYTIDNVAPYILEGNGKVTVICSGGQTMLCALTMKQVVDLIEK